MGNTLERLYALRAQMSAADLPLDAIDEKIRAEEDKASSWKKDLDEITSSFQTIIQPIVKKWGAKSTELQARYRDSELSKLVLNLDGNEVVLCQDSAGEDRPIQHSKRMKEALQVFFPDGFEVFEPQASVTLGKVIERIGPERIEPLNIRGLISRNPNEFSAFQSIKGGYYINTYSNTDTKRKHLEEISKKLGLNLIVKVVPGVYKSREHEHANNCKKRARLVCTPLLTELERRILNISPDIAVDKSLKSYLKFTFNDTYLANVLSRKGFLRVMFNDEYDRLKGLNGIIEAPDASAHYGHINRYYDVHNHDEIYVVVNYIIRVINLSEASNIPHKLRIRLDR